MGWGLLLGGSLFSSPSRSVAQAVPTAGPHGPESASPRDLRIATTEEVVYQGKATAGSEVAIGLNAGRETVEVEWRQVEGPTVAFEKDGKGGIRFKAPPSTARLAFTATANTPPGPRSTRVVVPVTAATTTTTDQNTSEELPIADAGDDQIGLAGRRITLNGSGSRPSGEVGFRWIHLSGPPINGAREDGPFYSFVPSAPGVYRFALVVGHRSRVSTPKVVAVEVGSRPDAAGARPSPPEPDRTPTLAGWVATATASIPSGAETAPRLGDIFDDVAGRVPLYSSFSQLQIEIARRLDDALPKDQTTRNLWATQVFVPLSRMTVAELLTLGVDLSVPVASERPLEPAQKERLAAYYRGLAAAFRSRPSRR